MCNQAKGLPSRMRAGIKPQTQPQIKGKLCKFCPLEQDDENQIFSSQVKAHCWVFSNVTSINICLTSASLKVKARDDGTGIPRNQPRAAAVEKGCDTARPVTADVVTSHPPHSSRAGPSGLKRGVPVVAYDTNQPPLTALPLWQNLTSNDYCGCLFMASLLSTRAGLLAVLLPANLSS